MKKLLLIALILITNFISAQTFTKYVDDAQKNGIGFNYNVTFQLTLKRMATKSTVSSAANGTEYSVRLVSVEVDQNSGWNQRGKTYSCSQLNGICNNKTFDRITIDLDYDCEGKELSSNSATFYNIGDEKIMTLQPKAVGSNVCASPTVSDIGKVTITEVSVTNTILSIIQKLDQNKSNTSTQNTNTGNQSNTNNSIGQIPDDYKSNPLHYNNSNLSSGSGAVDDFNKGYQQGQQISNIAIGLTDLFTPSPEQIQRREQEAAEYARQKKIKEDLRLQELITEGGNRFNLLYLPLMDKAIKGDENARMILCFASYNLFSTEKVPKRQQWLNEAYANNNTDAILEKSQLIEEKVGYGHYVVLEAIPYCEKAANLGSTDAMLILAEWYNLKKEFAPHGAGENAKLALEYLKKAAELGSPNAMFHLGMIYKYGSFTSMYDVSGTKSKSDFKKKYVTYNIILDEKKAFEYFYQSEQPNYLRSIFHKGRDKSAWRVCDGSYFNKGTYRELAIMYKEGKVVPKDKIKAKEYQTKYEAYKLDNDF